MIFSLEKSQCFTFCNTGFKELIHLYHHIAIDRIFLHTLGHTLHMHDAESGRVFDSQKNKRIVRGSGNVIDKCKPDFSAYSTTEGSVGVYTESSFFIQFLFRDHVTDRFDTFKFDMLTHRVCTGSGRDCTDINDIAPSSIIFSISTMASFSTKRLPSKKLSSLALITPMICKGKSSVFQKVFEFSSKFFQTKRLCQLFSGKDLHMFFVPIKIQS